MTDKKSDSGEEGIHTDFRKKMTYSDYLELDRLLSSQKPLSDHHDEMLFIIIHQVSELWMKLILHEIQSAIQAIHKDDLAEAFKMLSRVKKTQRQIISAWDVLSTLTPSEYIEFRDKLGQASGFQSYQYRLIEFSLGYKTPHVLKIYKQDPVIYQQLLEAYKAPGLYDAAIRALHRTGLPINHEMVARDFSEPYEADSSVEKAWLEVYENTDRYWPLYELAEKLVDIEDSMQQWRFRHMKTVERIIGYKTGTGGSSGVGYLKKVLDHYFFPELWNLRTKI